MPLGSAYSGAKVGLTSDDFLIWSRYGDTSISRTAELAGVSKRPVVQRLHAMQEHPYCVKEAAAARAAAAVSNAPKHMRSDVDRIVFGHDMDASESAVAMAEAMGVRDSWNDRRATAQDEATAAPAPDVAPATTASASRQPSRAGTAGPSHWAGPAAEYITVAPLNRSTPRAEVSSRRVGASRPSCVNPLPLSAQPARLLETQRGTAAFAIEMDRITRACVQAQRNRPRAQPSVVISPRGL